MKGLHTRAKWSITSCGIECAANWESKKSRMVGYKISKWYRATALATVLLLVEAGDQPRWCEAWRGTPARVVRDGIEDIAQSTGGRDCALALPFRYSLKRHPLNGQNDIVKRRIPIGIIIIALRISGVYNLNFVLQVKR